MFLTTHVVSNARKLILRAMSGAPVISAPEGAVISGYGVDNATATIWVCNGTENPVSWQGVSAGAGVVIVNNVPEDVAHRALDVYGDCPTSESLRDAIALLTDAGCVDQYTTSYDFMSSKLSPAGRILPNGSGVYKRGDRDLIEVYAKGEQYYVCHKEGDRLIRSEDLLRDYRTPNGGTIDLGSIQVRNS